MQIDKDATEEDLKELFAMSGKVGNIRYNTEKRQAAVGQFTYSLIELEILPFSGLSNACWQVN